MISQLRLIRGLTPARGDENTAEGIKQIISLTATKNNPWSLSTANFWIPGIPQNKSGIWNDFKQGEGRLLLAVGKQNVKETINLNLITSNIAELSQAIRDMQRFIHQAQLFWTSEHQIDPSYIEFYATDAPGPQYALIYTMDLAVSQPGPDDAQQVTRDVVITIEREPFWIPIPPGANPKIYTRRVLGDREGIDYTWSEYSHSSQSANYSGYAVSDAPALIEKTIQNRFEPDDSTWTAFNALNYVTINAADIAGDADALLLLVIDRS